MIEKQKTTRTLKRQETKSNVAAKKGGSPPRRASKTDELTSVAMANSPKVKAAVGAKRDLEAGVKGAVGKGMAALGCGGPPGAVQQIDPAKLPKPKNGASPSLQQV